MASFLHSAGWLVALLFLALLSCHEAPRNNPFDPALTPAVALTVVLDDTAGTATLTWTPYEGQQPFREYRVLRNIADRKSVDTLAHLPAVEQTAFVDTALEPNTAYVYRVEVVNTGGYAASSEEKGVAGYTVGPVSLVEVEVDAQQGQARLRWMRFNGARFAGYRVERRSSAEEVFGAIARLAGVQDTVYVDEGVEPEVVYFYRIVVEAAGQDWPSTPSSRQRFVLEPVPLLAATGDPQEGVVRLRWGRFTGPDFTGYQVRRRVGETIQEDLLAVLGQVQDTVLVDTTARMNVGYVYRVVVQAAGQELSSNTVETRLLLPPVLLSAPRFEARTASATLRWTAYEGPRFKAYRVKRRTAELAPQLVEELADLTSSAYVDTGLVGNTEYFYRVVVETQRGEEILSEEQSGIFHQRLATWPLEVEEGEYVRLYREGKGITALVAGRQRVRLFLFDAQGALMEEQGLMDRPFQNIEPRSVATALGEEGERFLGLGIENKTALLRFGVDGRLVRQEQEVFVDSMPLFTGPEGIVEGEVVLRQSSSSVFSDNAQVSQGDRVLFADDFEDGDLEGWDFLAPRVRVIDGWLNGGEIAKRDESWHEFRLEADVVFEPGSPPSAFGEISIGNGGLITRPSVHTQFQLRLRYEQVLRLAWIFTPPPNSGLERRGRRFSQPFPVFANIPYRLGLGFAAGQVRASVSTPLLWSSEQEEFSPWGSLAGIGESLVLTAGRQAYRRIPAEAPSAQSLLESPASEVRIWEIPGEAAQYQMGICLPAQHQAAFASTSVARTTGRLFWPFSILGGNVRLLGAQVGQAPGDLLYPLSLDGAPDGRVYVLDAGNARIQVFDPEGKYLTQWGRRGSDNGEFDFGSGNVPEDFAGSVAVDSEGYIYVAEVGNRRIQKFAP